MMMTIEMYPTSSQRKLGSIGFAAFRRLEQKPDGFRRSPE